MLMVDESNMNVKYWYYGTNRGILKYLEKNLPNATLFSTNPTWTCWESDQWRPWGETSV